MSLHRFGNRPGELLHHPRLMVLLWLLLVSWSRAGVPLERPNVLVLFSDDHRADAVGAYGNVQVRTPNLDRLAASGSLFTRAYCMGAMQGAVCVPSRAMLLSGRTLFRVSEKLERQPTWPEAFESAGYEIFMTGKWHNGEASLLRIFKNARSVFLGGMGWPYELPLRDVVDGKLGAPHMSGEHSVKVFADKAIEFIESRRDGKPWLCYVPFNAPHDPRVAPSEVRQTYDERKITPPPNFLPVHPFDITMMTVRDELLERWPRTREAVSRHLADYYASITHMDTQIGRILEALDKSGQRQRTLIVFAGDSGLAIGSHGLFGKQNIYEHSMRVPLIFSGPGIPKGVRRTGFAYLHDVFPTLGGLSGISGPAGSEGKSLAPVIQGKSSGVRKEVFLAFTQAQRSIRDDRWKLIRYPKVDVIQLFDLKRDPSETRNLASDPDEEDRVARMLARLESAQKDYGDTAPLTVRQATKALWSPPVGEVMEEMIRKNQTR